MTNHAFTAEEVAYRQSMSISRIRQVVPGNDWASHGTMVEDIRFGYNCTTEQAEALLALGILNGYIKEDKSGQIDPDNPTKAWNKYRIIEES